MAKKKTKAKKTKNPGSTIPESVTVAPEVNTAELDPKRTAKIKEAAAKAAAEAAAEDKEKAVEEESEAEKIAPKKAQKKAANKKTKANKNNSKKAAASKSGKNAKNGKKDTKKKPNRFVQWWKELGSEMKKIHWTNGKDTVKNTLIVLLVILVIGIGVWIVDWLLVKARTGIYNAATPDDAKNAIIMLKAAISYAGLTV